MTGSRGRPPLTHFLAIPLLNQRSAPALRSSVTSFLKMTRSDGIMPENSVSSQETDGLDHIRSSGQRQPHQKHDVGSDVKGSESNNDLSSMLQLSSHPLVQLPAGSVRPPTTLHLTLGVMSLSEPDIVEAAASMLRNMDLGSLLQRFTTARCSSQHEAHLYHNADDLCTSSDESREPTLPIKIRLKGLKSMQESNATTVLYASPEDDDGRLLRLCEALRAEFTAQRFLVPEKRELKLHATIMNTVYAKKQSYGRRGRREPLKVDARELITQWADYIWAEVTLEKVVLCEMGAKEDELGVLRYKEIAEARLE